MRFRCAGAVAIVDLVFGLVIDGGWVIVMGERRKVKERRESKRWRVNLFIRGQI